MADNEPGEHWDGFSIYSEVSRDIHQSVGQAIDSYSAVQASHSEDAKVRRDDAADHKAAILAAAHRLLTEMEIEVERNSANSQHYEKMLDNWVGDENEEGWITQLYQTNLSQRSPDWLHNFVREIHQAAWRLGYLKAGRKENAEENTVESNGREMVEDILSQSADA